MKKAVIWLFLAVLFSGCSDSSKEIERAMELRAKILAAESCCFDADITADYGDKIYTFSMYCQGDSKGDLHFTVTTPETIAGITGNLSDSGGKLTFDDTALSFALLTDDQLSPVSAPWILLKTLRSGYITSAGTDEGLLLASIEDSYDDDALHLDIWLDDSNAPIRAEILYDGKRILSLEVTNFQIR